ncbi:Glucose-regulated protein-like protein [Colletotrichum sojae]|uniref:Glucose-regulated protein-like protein n=1 Tax=Colletotrichum sojae TaxID=2175907 RepID=A0A8H6MWB4_9PEZI|nr:Glucose-regulated protein-like protein [Colletotrichum sojae]
MTVTTFGTGWVYKSRLKKMAVADRKPNRNATCASNEPHHFVSRRMNTPCSKDHPARRPGSVDIEALPSLFAEMKETAESCLQDDVEYAAVMVPDYYTREDYTDIKDAAKSVGLNIVLVKTHSAAAGTAYGVGWSQEDATVLFYDLGHETFQVSAYYADLGIFEPLANATDHQLAKKIDQALGTTGHSKRHYLDTYQMELVEQTLPVVERVTAEANLSKSDFNHLLISGAHTRHSQIRSLLEEFMGRRITPLGQDVELWRLWEPSNLDPDEVVTLGAAIFAAALSKPLPISRFNYPF